MEAPIESACDVGVAEDVLEHPGALEKVVRQHLPGEADAAVHLDRGRARSPGPPRRRGASRQRSRGSGRRPPGRPARRPRHRWRCGRGRSGRTCRPAGAGRPGRIRSGRRTARGRARSGATPPARRSDTPSSIAALSTVPDEAQPGGVVRVADPRASRERVAAPDRREGIEGRERRRRQADPTARRRTRRRRAGSAARRSLRRARRATGSPSRHRSCSTPPTRRSPLAAPSTYGAASVDHRTGPLDEVRAELLEDDRSLDHAEAEPAAGLGDEQARRPRARPSRATRSGRSAAPSRSRDPLRARTAPHRTGGRCPGARAVPRRGGIPCLGGPILARWKISKCYSRTNARDRAIREDEVRE